MIKCICIDDSLKPTSIPQHKWVKKGYEYTIIFAQYLLPQKEISVQLDEILLDETCAPYEYFLANRFAILEDDFQNFVELLSECNDVNVSIKELLEHERATDTSKEDKGA
jgi:hypothetical protein